MPNVLTPFSEQPIRIRTPPEVRTESLVLRPWSGEHVAALHEVVLANREHLLPWMAWAADEPRAIEEHAALVDRWVEAMRRGTELQCGVWLGERLAGSAGLMQRRDSGALEIGYWVDRELTGRRIATVAAYLLTEIAVSTEGTKRVQIWHDRANVASRRVPEVLGYELVREVPSEHLDSRCPGEEGVDCVWEMAPTDWLAGHGPRRLPTVGAPRLEPRAG